MKRINMLATAVMAVAFATSAFASDMPAQRPASPYYAPTPIAYSWTGFYGGVSGGYEMATAEDLKLKGGFVGGTLGYNAQQGNLVFGIEGDLFKNFAKDSLSFTDMGVLFKEEAQVNYSGSIRGRFGFAYDRTLFYGTAGWEEANFKATVSASAMGITNSASSTKNAGGLTYGGGIESFVNNTSSVKAEYRHTDMNVEGTKVHDNKFIVGINLHN